MATKYNLALLCQNDKHDQALIELSNKLEVVAPSVYVLGKNSLPHVTVCQFEAEPDELEGMWGEVKHLKPEFGLRLRNYYWRPLKTDAGYHYTGIEVTPDDELYDFHERVIQELQPIQPLNPVNREYYPHFTLGCCQLTPDTRLLEAMSYHPILEEKIQPKLALGLAGPEWQFEGTIYQQ